MQYITFNHYFQLNSDLYLSILVTQGKQQVIGMSTGRRAATQVSWDDHTDIHKEVWTQSKKQGFRRARRYITYRP